MCLSLLLSFSLSLTVGWLVWVITLRIMKITEIELNANLLWQFSREQEFSALYLFESPLFSFSLPPDYFHCISLILLEMFAPCPHTLLNKKKSTFSFFLLHLSLSLFLFQSPRAVSSGCYTRPGKESNNWEDLKTPKNHCHRHSSAKWMRR